ncbi:MULTISPECIES: MarR family winged helix-turn-helix transcriptional regulator [Glycomyces]|uniref:MarR family transcriptional regulator n=2 Tax=Glycomyces TaxID=58113 RepID=A0A9X3PJH8_9ACTN|nr:MarR family transcriptional regulator [Glycomyces lechevalierae]MDA1384768.1 MarR family transcriptional regulator [Glycomyces lechevalierae]MDR7337779.1 DNA-binding MarR family transcriptional regulator [Glycomyces lechevalierae]
MVSRSPDGIDLLAARLISQGSRFARTASRSAGEQRSLIALRVLANLQQEGDLRVGELAKRETITQPAMTATVNRLEEDGLVARGADPSDARASIVRITDSGATELAAFRMRAAARVRPVIETLGEDDLAVLARAAELLETLADRLNDR